MAAPPFRLLSIARRSEDDGTGETSLFAALRRSVDWEPVCTGRSAAVLVRCGDDARRGVPIVRTTTSYCMPAQQFGAIHADIVRDVRAAAVAAAAANDDNGDTEALDFNNAMLELYTPEYRTMGYHSDQALDLQPGSHIAIYSCYSAAGASSSSSSSSSARHCSSDGTRTLVVKDKQTSQTWRLPMHHNSVILFSLETNRRYAHKIVLERGAGGGGGGGGGERRRRGGGGADAVEPLWLGLTLRLSKTFVTFGDDRVPRFDGRTLRLATDAERLQFLRERGRENRQTEHTYPPLDVTLSPSDLLVPIATVSEAVAH